MSKPEYSLSFAQAHCCLSARLKQELAHTWERMPEPDRPALVRDFVSAFNRTLERKTAHQGAAAGWTAAHTAGRKVLARYRTPPNPARGSPDCAQRTPSRRFHGKV